MLLAMSGIFLNLGEYYRAKRCNLSVRLHANQIRRVPMNRALAVMLLLAATPSALPVAQEVQKPQIAKISLKVGDAAPDFTLVSNQRTTVKLSDLRGKKNVFLAVYVLAFTGG